MPYSNDKASNMKENYFFSQPHQPFFVLAFTNAIITMLLFMLSYKGVLTLTIAPSLFHAYSLIFLLFTPAFLGFILTTFPRFSNTEPIERSQYLSIFGLFLVGSLLFILGAFVSVVVYKIAIILTLIGQAWAVKILGHSDNRMEADKWVTNLFIWTQVVVVVRLLTSLVSAWGYNYMILFDISITVWLLMFIMWAIRYFAVLIQGKKLL